jgi:chromosome partitioning protein
VLKSRSAVADTLGQEDLMVRSMAFVSEKGGVGKSTTVLNVAAAMARKGFRVLVVDTDPQANVSYVLLRGEKPRRPTLSEVLVGTAEAEHAIVSTVVEDVSILPAETSLADVTVTLAGELGRERRLRVAMEGAEQVFDFVLVDTAPTRSLLTTNVLNYVGEIMIPIAPGLFGVLGLGQLQADVNQVRRFLDNRALRIGGIFLTMTEKNNVGRDLEGQLRELFGEIVFTTKIPRNIKLEEAHSRHESILTYAPKSAGAAAYLALTQEILDHGREANRVDGTGGDSPAHHAA